jgi:ADP-heptose:LPS heptosyltransferase
MEKSAEGSDNQESKPGRVAVHASRFWRLFPAGMRRRWWLFRPLDLMAKHWPVFKKRKGVLVVRMDGIGDMVLFRPSLDHYADALGVAKDEITVLGCDSWGPITDVVFGDYNVVTIEEHAYARRPLYRFRINLMVRRLAPKITVCDSYLRRAMMADSLVWVSSAETTITSMPYVNEPTRSEFTFYLSQCDEVIDTGSYPTHEIDRHFTFVSHLANKTIQPVAPQIEWDHPAPDFAKNGRYVLMNPGSNEPGRRWPFESYIEAAEKFIADGYQVAFVGTRDERWDAALLREVSKKSGVTDLTGQTTLSELLTLMKHAALVISNDTGPAHLSIALGAPTIVIVGGGHFSSFVPYPEHVCPVNARFVYQVMDCYHCFWRCHKRANKFQVFPCVAAIPVDKVWEQSQRLLGGQ